MPLYLVFIYLQTIGVFCNGSEVFFHRKIMSSTPQPPLVQTLQSCPPSILQKVYTHLHSQFLSFPAIVDLRIKTRDLTIPFPVSNNIFIYELKHIIAEVLGIDGSTSQLFLCGELLADGICLSDYLSTNSQDPTIELRDCLITSSST